MIYLIGKLALGLILTAVVAGLAGWAWASARAAAGFRAAQRERENLVRDIMRFASGEGWDAAATEREVDSMRRLIEVRDGRINELSRLLETARMRADDAIARAAEAERTPLPAPDQEELLRLRAAVRDHESERAREVIVAAPPPADDESVLQSWRLRYFEQRVRYLEGNERPATHDASPLPEWRAREAQARARFLESELRAAASALPPMEVEAFASDSDVDALLRWRMLYLERRVAHLRSESAGAPEPTIDPVEAERWKWRARYLEARVRHLEQAPAPVLEQRLARVVEAEPPAPAIAAKRAKPPVLAAARNGAPDDFTLIEGVSSLQQTTLYSLGVFHFDQIAAWTPENVAWVEQYLRLGGRVDEEEWVEQAIELARHGVAARRVHESEDA
ncbi:MAG: hypothetical protein JNM59_00810 [Hyphomonadaceae bacterium]|nr:hypothetical protein [Hyphomonadaceae bacterium]